MLLLLFAVETSFWPAVSPLGPDVWKQHLRCSSHDDVYVLATIGLRMSTKYLAVGCEILSMFDTMGPESLYAFLAGYNNEIQHLDTL